ncbi:MAG: hypothetical protein ABWY78_15225 [Microvirga sp.]
MRAIRVLLAFEIMVLGCGAAVAEDCPADRAAADGRIGAAIRALERELDPYELAVRAGDLAAFETRAEPVARLWDGLLDTIHSERARIASIPCPVEGVPNEYRLPVDWDMVRDLGARQVVDLDRRIAELNAGSQRGRAPLAGMGQ